MWILVVGKEALLQRPDGCVSVLEELGCRVHTADLWDSLCGHSFPNETPGCIVVEAFDEMDAGRAALLRLRGVEAFADVPVIAAVTVNALGRLDMADGFDDFALVPYVAPELYARIRRAEWRRSEFSSQERIKIGGLMVDLAAHEVWVDGVPIELTNQEFNLLSFLCQHRGRVFSREQLLTRAWGVDYYGSSRTVDIHVRRLRQKLGLAAEPIRTVRGAGYKMVG